ncbi:alpha/beta hydrolase-fold protein [Terrabacter sp. 2RAF25]|uniref:alpha/beta hydrolase-fold protein n=1 Tax=Terrabacter sp. 2RAF25 TaxID=3232998 RepID=UPI003F98F1C2
MTAVDRSRCTSRRNPEAVVFAGDGELLAEWGPDLEAADVPPTLIVGVHRVADEMLRLHENSPGFDPERFAEHEAFFVKDVRAWAQSRFGLAMPAARTAVYGVSASGELALALGLRHPEIYGAVFCASPGAGFQPPVTMPSSLPRAYFVAGTQEPFFRDNASRWATAFRGAGVDVVPDRAGRITWRPLLAPRVPTHGGMGVRALTRYALIGLTSRSGQQRSTGGGRVAADDAGRTAGVPRAAWSMVAASVGSRGLEDW